MSETCEECGGDMGGFHFKGCPHKRNWMGNKVGAVFHSPALSIPEPGQESAEIVPGMLYLCGLTGGKDG